MTRREHKQARTLKVRIRVEPSRLSPDWVAQAYEQVVPILRRARLQPSATPQRERDKQRQRVGRREAL